MEFNINLSLSLMTKHILKLKPYDATHKSVLVIETMKPYRCPDFLLNKNELWWSSKLINDSTYNRPIIFSRVKKKLIINFARWNFLNNIKKSSINKSKKSPELNFYVVSRKFARYYNLNDLFFCIRISRSKLQPGRPVQI